MAQLDLTTYWPQVVWLLIIFMLFYFIVQKNIIPTVSTNVKLRIKKLSQGQGLNEGLVMQKASRGGDCAKIWQKVLQDSGERGQGIAQRMMGWSGKGMQYLPATAKVKVDQLPKFDKAANQSFFKMVLPSQVVTKASAVTAAKKGVAKNDVNKVVKPKAAKGSKKGQAKHFSSHAVNRTKQGKRAAISYLKRAGAFIALKGALNATFAAPKVKGKARGVSSR